MVKSAALGGSWREAQRAAARQTIIEAAWQLVREEGLGGLSMRDLAARAGTTVPTVYAYFESKHAIFDALFADGQRAFDAQRSVGRPEDPVAALRWLAETFVRFCTEDQVRYQLLFQHSVPRFAPSEESFALARVNLEVTSACLAAIGLTRAEHLEVWTALWAGVVSQQNANDPGGDRWTQHLDTMLEMYLKQFPPNTSRRRRLS